ncbi:Putative SWI/SNF-related matrix-associated actin-dependent regulator of chromatin subfamily A member 3-like [Arachis hypogaea]|nr:Putative SWI/SNF-related matrix-associated actin-dependent regulator of chromatin subfamily A member 3-like [Arachis hypogaea]
MEPENVINAYNKHSRRFGFLEAADVEILSPLMDLGDSILLEAVIPARINRSRRLRITCKILISTSLNLSDQITQYIHYCGRRLIGPLDDEFMEPAAKETTALKKFKAVDYSFADLEKKLASAESIVKTRALEPPEGIVRTRLLQHQKEGLWWLLKREECEELPPFWVEKAGGEFFNILTEESNGPTLIVCPVSVVSTWISQLEDHIFPDSLSCLKYYGDESPVKKVAWNRIILDQVEAIKFLGAGRMQMVMHLNTKRRWAVTSTPIKDGYVDTFALMYFLGYEPFSNGKYWNRFIQSPIKQGLDSGHERFEVLMKAISLRRTKDNELLGVPPKTIETLYVELNGEERKIIVPSDLANTLRLTLEDVSNNPELLQKLVVTLQECEAYECPICCYPSANIVITRCTHIFCRLCILRIIQSSGSPHCPLCRGALSESDLFSAPIEPSRADSTSSSSSSDRELSSKTSALIKFLKESREQKPTAKLVVFSQFRKVLVLLEVPLKEAGFKTLRIDGLMTAEQRAGVIDQFQDTEENGLTVLLASLRVSGAGVNLTAATTVYFMEPCCNAAVEEQAMDRVHCIGQKEAVRIVRLVVRDSIEEKMLILQEKRRGSHSSALKYKDLNFPMSIE